MKTLFLCVLQILFVSSAWAECSFNMRVNDSPPYYYHDGNEYKGMFVEQAQSLASLVGCSVKTKKAPWGRSLRLLQDGTIDLMANMSITEERKIFLRFLGPHHFEEIVLVVSADSDYQINSHADLLNLPAPIGVERDAYYGPELKKLLKQPGSEKKWTWFTGEKQYSLNERVRLGRLSGFLDVAKPDFKAEGLKYHSFIINSDPVFFGVSKKSVSEEKFKELQDAFENGGKAKIQQIAEAYKKQ